MSWAASLIPACEALVAELEGAGLRATLDRTKLPVPGAWVRPDTAGRLTLRGGRARCSVLLVCQPAGDVEVLADLVELLEKALQVIEPDEDVDTSVVLPHNGNALPAFRVVVDLELEE